MQHATRDSKLHSYIVSTKYILETGTIFNSSMYKSHGFPRDFKNEVNKPFLSEKKEDLRKK